MVKLFFINAKQARIYLGLLNCSAESAFYFLEEFVDPLKTLFEKQPLGMLYESLIQNLWGLTQSLSNPFLSTSTPLSIFSFLLPN